MFINLYRGSNEWVDIHTYESTESCVSRLKQQGYKILVTDIDHGAIAYDKLEKEILVPSLTGYGKFAFVFGSEKWGVSDEVQ